MEADGYDWMSPREQAMALRLAMQMRDHLDRRGVADSPLVALRLEDVIAARIHVHRVEVGMGSLEISEDTKAVVVLIEAAGKARERMRKAMKEFEDACAKAGTPIDRGLADQLKPLLQKTAGVIEDALRFEQEKKAESTG